MKKIISKKKINSVGRPKVNDQNYKKRRSLRASDQNIDLILKKHNISLQQWFDKKINDEIISINGKKD